MAFLLDEFTKLIGTILIIGEKEAGKTTLLDALSGRPLGSPDPTKISRRFIRGVHIIEIGSHYKQYWEEAIRKNPSMVLYVMDISRLELDIESYKQLNLGSLHHIILANKVDLLDSVSNKENEIRQRLERIKLAKKEGCVEVLTCSALYKRGLRDILKVLARFRQLYQDEENVVISDDVTSEIKKQDEKIIRDAINRYKDLFQKESEDKSED